MKRKRTTRSVDFSFERREFFVTVNPGLIFLCAQCGKESPFVTPTDAARVAASSIREIFRRIETGQIHFLETSDRSLLVCLDSITQLS